MSMKKLEEFYQRHHGPRVVAFLIMLVLVWLVWSVWGLGVKYFPFLPETYRHVSFIELSGLVFLFRGLKGLCLVHYDDI
jgi:hypothetical protein